MRVLVTGAYGFIGAHIVAALVAADHEVVCAVRGARLDSRFPGLRAVACDMSRDITVEDWLPRLAGIDAVVNCAGILREKDADSFETVHVRAPLALYKACVQAGVRRAVQISTLGHADDGEFIASKHRGDDQLAALPIDACILRPSLVYSAHGSYGGTSLLRAMAALPGVIVVPREALSPCVQPIAAEDVGLAVVAALARPAGGAEILELVGPQAMGLADYLRRWRGWLGLRPARLWVVPTPLARAACWVGERLGQGPLGATMQRMLERGNLGAPGSLQRMHERLAFRPRTLERALAEAPSHVQDRWHARLYLTLPGLRLALAGLWLASGVVGWSLSADAVLASAQGGPLPAHATLWLARGTATLDLLLGVLCLLRWRPRWVLGGMLLMLAGYTLGIGTLWPAHWLDPLGGLLKNVPLMAAILVLLATEEKR
ncbi:NAD-dependent epimerase/dehydratase family protein [Dyella sp. C9]|uniref:NAD-dependent epimerase/dehydratase family protein n=1 Tax=Dyella sp. C9 TaxID=2202154 RepID=UPI000DEF5067|nr:NAD-dependent epimerase/dehydratase family protein [Dyella sp. C9]